MHVSSQNRTRSLVGGGSFHGWARRVLLLWDHPLWSALLAGGVYALIAANHGGMWQASKYSYFNGLADAFLHGQLHLRTLPQSFHDLSIFQNRAYLYWPPFPALVLLPFVALWGIGFSDILFTIVLGAANVALVAVLLQQAQRRGLIDSTPTQRALLVLTFALGSVHVTLAPYGRVWYTAQLIGFACVALAYLATLTLRGWRAFFFTGLALACALLTRNHLVLVGVWPAVFLLREHRNTRWIGLLRSSLAGLLPIVGAVALLGLYNWARFGSFTDNGLDYHRMARMFRLDYAQYGAFNLHYLPTNLRYQLLAYPFPWDRESTLGGSLFLLTPVFVAAFWGLIVGKPRWSVAGLGGSIALVAIPILLLMGTGWHQFGPRYTLDFTIPLLLLTALGIRRWPSWLLAALTLIAVGHYLVGAVRLSDII
jgi:hypothetical protein